MDRMKKLSKHILQWLSEWANVTADQQENLRINVRYATTIINRQASSAQGKCTGTLPFMQIQGCAKYCGVCAFNNLMGEEIMTVQSFNNIADDLWLRQCEQFEIESLQYHRDISGFYSINTIEEVADCHGCCLNLLSANAHIRAVLTNTDTAKTPQVVLQELTSTYTVPLKLFLADRETQHYTAVHICPSTIWHFDPKKRVPTSLTPSALVAKLKSHSDTTYALIRKQSEGSTASEASLESEVNNVFLYIHTITYTSLTSTYALFRKLHLSWRSHYA